MEYFHKLNIAHRDIKPENLFLDDNFNIKVGDFGLSNQFGSDTLLNTSCGSPCYAAPEMISNKPYSGITVDIWASGVVLFAMLCGYLPFNYPEDQTTLLFSEIKKGNYKIPPFVSKEARHLIKNILNIDNRTRYSVEQIKSHPWYQIHWNYHYKLPGVVVSLQKIPVDEVILAKVKEFNYDPEVVRKDLLENRHNPNTSL
jgi:5'-AMP-activated protein kinase catalytic alpha subunit